jgi:acetyl esterase/lipase
VKKIVLLGVIAFLSHSAMVISQYKQDSDCVDCPEEHPIVYESSQFNVESSTEIYAQGLRHDDWMSESTEEMDLLLDIYEPVDAAENRPVIIFIHGGGYVGGSRVEFVRAGEYFAERGWVAISIDYRLARDHGTIPQEWYDAVMQAPIFQQQKDQALAIYAASRDAKAAVRWVYANAETYHINTDYISVLGGSAGAGLAVMLGITEDEDFRDELTLDDDPTLESTNLDQDAEVHTVLNMWGTTAPIELLSTIYDLDRFDENDAPILIVHGTDDAVVDFSHAEYLRYEYEETGVDYAFYPLDGEGHSAWQARVDGMMLSELAFSFITEHQQLIIGE